MISKYCMHIPSFGLKILLTLASPIVLLIMVLFPRIMILSIVVSVWLLLVVYMFVRYRTTIIEVISLCMSMCSCVLLLILVESGVLRWLLVIVSIPLFFFLIWMSSEYTGRLVHIKEKPLRRMRMMIHVFNVYAWYVALFAIHLYFPTWPLVVLVIVGGLYTSLASMLIWKLYFKTYDSDLTIATGIVGLITAELLWAISLLPFGYLAQGLIVAWIWYIAQLLMRFYLSPRGIMWKKQIGFLTYNVLLFCIVLYTIRWI